MLNCMILFQDAKVMSWWDYGYQITAMANRTILVDNNTWNNTHISRVGQVSTATRKKRHAHDKSLWRALSTLGHGVHGGESLWDYEGAGCQLRAGHLWRAYWLFLGWYVTTTVKSNMQNWCLPKYRMHFHSCFSMESDFSTDLLWWLPLVLMPFLVAAILFILCCWLSITSLNMAAVRFVEVWLISFDCVATTNGNRSLSELNRSPSKIPFILLTLFCHGTKQTVFRVFFSSPRCT